ncbi:MAG: NACHT domain-containing protein, partial [Rhodobacteraceae bacterium]|nr:NACHT domain-containing protein [Paracoccaceae bacterium]
QALIAYCLRHNQLPQLEAQLRDLRPKVAWPDLTSLADKITKVQNAIAAQEQMQGILSAEQLTAMLTTLRGEESAKLTQLWGDFTVAGDMVGGDKIGGDNLNVGDVNDVQGMAIGEGARAVGKIVVNAEQGATVVISDGDATVRSQPASGRSSSDPALQSPPESKPEFDPKVGERKYLQHLMDLCGHPPSMALIDIKEAGLGGQKLALERIFTSLDVPAHQDGRNPTQFAIQFDKLDRQERNVQLERESALQAMSHPENDRLVLLGAPGSGKSTLVNYLTLCLAGDHLASTHGGKVTITQSHLHDHGWQLSDLRLFPVRVVLREYAARGLPNQQTLWQFIAADLSRPAIGLDDYVPHLQQQLQESGGILLLDGLDEVDKATTLRDRLKANIEAFADQFPRVRLVVTSRPYAYGHGWELRHFEVTRLLDFSEEQIQFFIKQWYTVMGQQDLSLGVEKAAHYSQSLIHQIDRNPNLQEMAQHPLLLTMMVYIHRGREGGALPQRREELYRLSVMLLLDLWRRSKSIVGQETPELADELGMDTKRLLRALSEVAFVAHRDQPENAQTADIPGALLVGTLFKHRSDSSKVNLDDVVEYVRDRAGLLQDHGRNADDSDDVYRFPHRTFQEYLAAMHLLNAPDFPAEMVQLARHDLTRWREAVLLAGQVEHASLKWALVEGLYGAKAVPDSGMSEADWQGAFLAGQVMVENEDMIVETPPMHREKRERVQAWQLAIVTQGALAPRDRALAGR